MPADRATVDAAIARVQGADGTFLFADAMEEVAKEERELFGLPITLYGVPVVMDPNPPDPAMPETTPTFGTLTSLFERWLEPIAEFRGSSDPTGKDCRFTCECGHELPSFQWTGQSKSLICPECGAAFVLRLEKP